MIKIIDKILELYHAGKLITDYEVCTCNWW